MVLWIGVDDTDSRRGGCTTYIAALLAKKLREKGFKLIGYPRLIRLNPNCPFKTRGNAAISLKVDAEKEDVKGLVKMVVEENAELDEEGVEPGIAFIEEDPPEELRRFYWRALREIVPLEDGFKLAKKIGAELIYYKGGRGVIGALAAIGADLSIGRTYELIAYRKREYWGTVRHIDPSSVYEMDEATKPLTFDNIDPESGEIRIAPHTPCPVLLGIRGVNPDVLMKAYKMLRIGEPVELVTIFETNQGTDAHLQPMKISQLREGVNAIIDGIVSERPRFEVGGHVFFKLSDGTGEVICAAYEPTKSFRHVVSKLIPGDEIAAYGAVKLKPQGLTLNLEKIYVKKLKPLLVRRPPNCPRCGRRMESAGAGKGFRCRRCGLRVGEELVEIFEAPRGLKPGFYEVPPSARRHLSKPLSISSLH